MPTETRMQSAGKLSAPSPSSHRQSTDKINAPSPSSHRLSTGKSSTPSKSAAPKTMAATDEKKISQLFDMMKSMNSDLKDIKENGVTKRELQSIDEKINAIDDKINKAIQNASDALQTANEAKISAHVDPGVEPFICEKKSTALKYFLGCRTP